MPEDRNFDYMPTRKLDVGINPTQFGQNFGENRSATVVPATPIPPTFKPAEGIQQMGAVSVPQPTMYMTALPSTEKPQELGAALHTRCKQLGVSVFFNGPSPVRSLGFVSAIAGEGKTFLARLTAESMAEDNGFPVTLLECNWENPTLSSAYNLGPGPGLSDWLLGRCDLSMIRRQVTGRLTIIPAGDGSYNPTQLLRAFQQRGVYSVLANPDEVLIIDLPATVTTAYGPLAAHLAESLILVVRMGVTPEPFVVEATNYLKGLHVHGVILNQVATRIPRWLRRIL